jgi:hypothetical protein
MIIMTPKVQECRPAAPAVQEGNKATPEPQEGSKTTQDVQRQATELTNAYKASLQSGAMRKFLAP